MPSISREYETSSETESESVPIYTPSRGSSHADVLELESSPLLPEDEKSSLCHQGTETSKMGGVSGGEDADAAAGSGGGRGHWCKHRGHSGAFLRTRRRHKHILAIAGLKVLMLAAVLVFFLTTGDWNWKLSSWHFWHRCHHQGHHDTEQADYSSLLSDGKREIVVDNGPRSIWGNYPLLDLLSLTTTSGSVAIAITPQPADPKKPDEPAIVRIRTGSGSIAVSFKAPHDAAVMVGADDEYDEHDGHNEEETHKKDKNKNKDLNALPPRPYEIYIHSDTGSITGRFVFSSASISTVRGSISALLVPIRYDTDSEKQPSLHTSTEQGSQNIRFAEPIIVPAAASEKEETATVNLNYHNTPQATHTSTQGSINIHYPEHWAGEVHAKSSDGRICLDGKGLRVNKSGDGYADGFKEAEDGDEGYAWWGGRGDMNVSLATRDGSIVFFVG